MIKVAIAEDDRAQARQMQELLSKFFKERSLEYNLDVYSDGIDLVGFYNNKYDIVLLDIEMPVLNGLQTAQRLRNADPSVQIIFVTNLAQYALNGYDVNAVGFLVKPVKYFSLSLTLQKAVNYVRNKSSLDVVVNTKNGFVVIPSSSLVYVEVRSHEIIYVTEEKEIRSYGTLRAVEKTLEEGGAKFACCSRCYLVNLKFVRAVEGSTLHLSNCKLQISRGKRGEFVEKYMRYAGGKNA